MNKLVGMTYQASLSQFKGMTCQPFLHLEMDPVEWRPGKSWGVGISLTNQFKKIMLLLLIITNQFMDVHGTKISVAIGFVATVSCLRSLLNF